MPRRLSLLFLVVGALAPVACSRARAPSATSRGATVTSGEHPSEPFGRLSLGDLAGRLERHERVLVYDNNARERYEQGHIPGARWVGHDEVTASILPTDHATPLVFYCANEH